MMNCDICGNRMDERAAQTRFGIWFCIDCDHNHGESEIVTQLGLEHELHFSQNQESGDWQVFIQVYTPDDKQQDFEIVCDEDFTDYAVASHYAEKLSNEWGIEINEY